VAFQTQSSRYPAFSMQKPVIVDLLRQRRDHDLVVE